jgi:hypothetical protein
VAALTLLQPRGGNTALYLAIHAIRPLAEKNGSTGVGHGHQ